MKINKCYEMNKHTRYVSLIDGHTEDERGITDTEKVLLELKSASEWFDKHGRNTNTAIIGICNRAVDLINRQQADIERLKEERDFYKAPSGLLAKGIEQIKSEAIKEFAERFKQKYDKPLFYLGSYEQFMREVDNLVKEMTEEKENG